MAGTFDRAARIRKQQLHTDRFLGMEFVPVETSKRPNVKTSTVVHDAERRGGNLDVRTFGRSDVSPPRTEDDKAAALEALRQRHDAKCPHCTTAEAHTQTVFGEGHPNAGLMFIGEAPGEQEDKTGRPFVGRAGQKLDEMIKAMKLQREQVYIANVLKSRPPNNRAPLQNEVDGCSPYLVEQIRIIQPKVIVTLGGPATKLMLNTDIGITRLRGQWHEYADPECQLHIPIMPTFHPAYLLRNYTKETRQKVWADLQATMQQLRIDA